MGVEVDNITGLAGNLMVKSLHTIYSKKQNCKFPQYVFKINNHITFFGYIYNVLMAGKWEVLQNLVSYPKGKESVQRHMHGCDTNINLYLNLI